MTASFFLGCRGYKLELIITFITTIPDIFQVFQYPPLIVYSWNLCRCSSVYWPSMAALTESKKNSPPAQVMNASMTVCLLLFAVHLILRFFFTETWIWNDTKTWSMNLKSWKFMVMKISLNYHACSMLRIGALQLCGGLFPFQW